MANNDGNIVKRASQYIDNIAFDETTQLPMTQIAGTDGSNVYRVAVNENGAVSVLSPGLVGTSYTSVEITAYDSNDNPTTVVFKDGAETKATLTLSYDSSGRFVSVVRA